MFTPTSGGPTNSEVEALLMSLRKRLAVVEKELVYVTGLTWELSKKLMELTEDK